MSEDIWKALDDEIRRCREDFKFTASDSQIVEGIVEEGLKERARRRASSPRGVS